jgi:hypothetical protein
MIFRTPDILTISTGIIHTTGVTDTPIGDAQYRVCVEVNGTYPRVGWTGVTWRSSHDAVDNVPALLKRLVCYGVDFLLSRRIVP